MPVTFLREGCHRSVARLSRWLLHTMLPPALCVGLSCSTAWAQAFVSGSTVSGPALVTVIDSDPASPTFNTVIGTIENQLKNPTSIAFTKDGGATAFVSGWGDARVEVLDLISNNLAGFIPIDADDFFIPHHFLDIGLDPEFVLLSGFAYVTSNTPPDGFSVSVVNTFDGNVVAKIPLEAQPWAIAVRPDGLAAYVLTSLSGAARVSVIDTVSKQVVKDILLAPDSAGPGYIACRPDGAFVYGSGNRLWVINALSNQVVAELRSPSPYGFGRVAFRPDGAYAYAVVGGTNQVVIIDPNYRIVGTLTFPIGSPGSVGDIAVSAQGYMYVTDGVSTVFVVYTLTNQIVATITLQDPNRAAGIVAAM